MMLDNPTAKNDNPRLPAVDRILVHLLDIKNDINLQLLLHLSVLIDVIEDLSYESICKGGAVDLDVVPKSPVANGLFVVDGLPKVGDQASWGSGVARLLFGNKFWELL